MTGVFRVEIFFRNAFCRGDNLLQTHFTVGFFFILHIFFVLLTFCRNLLSWTVLVSSLIALIRALSGFLSQKLHTSKFFIVSRSGCEDSPKNSLKLKYFANFFYVNFVTSIKY